MGMTTGEVQIYTSSHVLRDQHRSVRHLDFASYKELQDGDILLTTGTFGDEIALRYLIDLGKVPYVFLIRKPNDTEINPFIAKTALVFEREDYALDDAFVERCKEVAHKLRQFDAAMTEAMEAEKEEEEREEAQMLYAMWMLSTFAFQAPQKVTNPVRSAVTQESEASYRYIIQQLRTTKENKKVSESYLYILKEKEEKSWIKTFKIGREDISTEEIEEKVDFQQETIFDGNYNTVEELQPLKIEDITHKYKEAYLLYYAQDESPKIKDVKPLEGKITEDGIEIENLNITHLFFYLLKTTRATDETIEKLRLALVALKNLLQNKLTLEDYTNLNTFLRYTNTAKMLYNNLNYDEKKRFNNKKTPSYTHSKNFETITRSKHYETMLDLRYDMVMGLLNKNEPMKNISGNITRLELVYIYLYNEDINNLSEKNIVNTLFQDIKNGINIGKMAKEYFNEHITENQYKRFEKSLKEVENHLGKTTFENNIYARLKDNKYIETLINETEDEKHKKQLQEIVAWNNIEETSFDTMTDNPDAAKYQADNTFDFEKIERFLLSLFEYKGDIKINPKNIIKLIGIFLADITVGYEKGKHGQNDDYICFTIFINEWVKNFTGQWKLGALFKNYIDEEQLLNRNNDIIQYIKDKLRLDISCNDENVLKVKDTDNNIVMEVVKKNPASDLNKYRKEQLQKLTDFLGLIDDSDNCSPTELCQDEKTKAFLSIFAGQQDKIDDAKCEQVIGSFCQNYTTITPHKR